MTLKKYLFFAGVSGAIAVMLGAMGAHYLKLQAEAGKMTSDQLQSFGTGVQYHLYHTLALIVFALLADRFNIRLLDMACNFLIAGILFFSGSIYLLSTRSLFGIDGWSWLGPVTPLGGMCFITGWLLFAFSFLKKNKTYERKL